MLRRGLCNVPLPTRPDAFLEPIPPKGFRPGCSFPEGPPLQFSRRSTAVVFPKVNHHGFPEGPPLLTLILRPWLARLVPYPPSFLSCPKAVQSCLASPKVFTFRSGTDVPSLPASAPGGPLRPAPSPKLRCGKKTVANMVAFANRKALQHENFLWMELGKAMGNDCG